MFKGETRKLWGLLDGYRALSSTLKFAKQHLLLRQYFSNTVNAMSILWFDTGWCARYQASLKLKPEGRRRSLASRQSG